MSSGNLINQKSRIVTESEMNTLISVNNLTYKRKKNLTVVVSREQNKVFFQRSSYVQGETPIVELSVGSHYLDPKNCYLTFDAYAVGTGPTSASFGNWGSAVNLFRSIVVESRGKELERLDDVNVHNAMVSHFNGNAEWMGSIGRLKGAKGEHTHGVPTDNFYGLVNKRRFVIPLHDILGVFNTNTLLPPHLVNGMRITFNLETAQRAFVWDASVTANGGFVIENIALQLDQYKLSDAFERRINSMAQSKDGLEYMYETYNSLPYQLTGGVDKADIDVRTALSQVYQVIVVTRLDSALTSYTLESISAGNNRYADYIMRLGSLYFPRQRLDSEYEHYFNALRAFELVKNSSKSPHLRMNDYVADANGSQNCLSETIERSALLELSGKPMNNNNSLNVSISYTDTVNRSINVYVRHVRLARLFMNNMTLQI